MKTITTALQINHDRVNAEVAKLEAQLATTKKFIEDCIFTLLTQEANIIDVVSKFGGNNLTIGNFFSTSNMNGPEYTPGCSLHGTMKFTLSKEYKNLELLAQRFNEAFRQDVVGVSATLHDFKITGTEVVAEIWIPTTK